ncbi:MAG: type II secretion system minor pseudopilin GspK [bacterium]
MKVSPEKRTGQKGAALIIVLLLVASMSILATEMILTSRQATQKTYYTTAYAQSYWYGLGAETLSSSVLKAQWQANPAHDAKSDAWFKPQIFPFETGQITAQLKDHTACFNVNSLIKIDEDNQRIADPSRVSEFTLLLTALGLDEFTSDALAALVVDWQDSDSYRRAGGAEDNDYSRAVPPYRAGNTAFADVSEFRALAGIDAEFYHDIKPFLCALPGPAASNININMLTVDKAPLLYALLEGKVDLLTIQGMIRAIPPKGYTTIEAFWAQPALQGGEWPDITKKRLRLWSDYVIMEAKINHNGANLSQQTLFAINNSGMPRIIRRKFGLNL